MKMRLIGFRVNSIRSIHYSRIIYNSFNESYNQLKERASVINSNNSISFLKDCNNLQNDIYQSDKFDSMGKSHKVSSLISESLHKIKLNEDILRQYWLLQPNFTNILNSITVFNDQNPNKVIDVSVMMIPFRKLIYDGEIDKAIKLVDSTVASDKYIQYKQSQRQRNLYKFWTLEIGFLGGVDVVVRIFFENMVGYMMPIYLMMLTYLTNVSFLLSMLFNAGKGDHLILFSNGTFQKFWYCHTDELRCMSKIVELDLKMNDRTGTGFISSDIARELLERNMKFIEPEHEIMLRQYWVGGGDGFVWSEPDLDPLDLLWENHLNDLKLLNLNESENKAPLLE